ncbi:hypothetical protein KIH87_19055 [Paraneptunicella aestuarii]|uniref:hypothetical protein n=1 Tax=Paraneptunicella aestuarii TaxID=2831148 RepID=UPI001E4A2913|nr:hypothetical protein [Paraneptunicella aestuarii]UAA38731.1 hypothetical protein KIH87_19055 [Paraneptunicella aestuarii]
MPSNRFDDDIPKITLDREDREAFHQSRSKGKYKTSNEPEVTTSSSTSEVKVSSSPSPVWTTVLLILIFAAFGASYWLYQQQVKNLQQLDNAQQRIAELERQLSATGEEMGESAVALQAKVSQLDAKSKELWEQMDKLWASAWRRNQSDIKKLTDLLDTMNTDSADFEKQFKVIQAELTASTANFGLLQEQLDKQINEAKGVNKNIADLQKVDAERYKKILEMDRKLTAADKIASELLQRIKELEKWRETELKTKPEPEVIPSPKKDIPPPLTVG